MQLATLVLVGVPMVFALATAYFAVWYKWSKTLFMAALATYTLLGLTFICIALVATPRLTPIAVAQVIIAVLCIGASSLATFYYGTNKYGKAKR